MRIGRFVEQLEIEPDFTVIPVEPDAPAEVDVRIDAHADAGVGVGVGAAADADAEADAAADVTERWSHRASR